MHICPISNGLMDYIKYCSRCGERMEVLDRVENYYDDYSPYLSYELTNLNEGDSKYKCSHFCFCPSCGTRDIIEIRNIIE
jgi:hypothetical protein